MRTRHSKQGPTPAATDPGTASRRAGVATALLLGALALAGVAAAAQSPSPNEPTRLAQPTPVVVDHTSIADFERIPARYITAASELRMLFRHASVGANIDDGLSCLGDAYEPRPHRCDRDLASDEIVYDARYDRSRWTFEFHSPPPNPNPGWWNKVGYFIERVNGLGPDEPYDVVGFKFGYVDAFDGSTLPEDFFDRQPGDRQPGVEDLEALEAEHPELTHMWWTIALARRSFPESEAFNRQLRAYARAEGKVLMDVAAIESHAPDGSPCASNLDPDVEGLCPDYTNEHNGGHLNARGRLRMAKAMWVMMARMAGWDGADAPGGPSPTATASATPTPQPTAAVSPTAAPIATSTATATVPAAMGTTVYLPRVAD